MSASRTKSRAELRRERRPRPHPCWDHLVVAPLWPLHGANLGTLLRTCDAVGACLVVPRQPWVPEALARGNTLLKPACDHWSGASRARRGAAGRARPRRPRAVEIPMMGTGARLDVAVAGSLVLYRLAGLL